jgi:hypothetical protein
MSDLALLVREFHVKYGLPLDQDLRRQTTATFGGDNGTMSLRATAAIRQTGQLLMDQARSWKDAAELAQGMGDGRLYRCYMAMSELGEFFEAIATGDESKTAHEAVDLIYIMMGSLEQFNLPFGPIFMEVHRANMTRKVDNFRDKTPPYTFPDLKRAIGEGRLMRKQVANRVVESMPGVQPRERDTLKALCDCGGYCTCGAADEANKPREQPKYMELMIGEHRIAQVPLTDLDADVLIDSDNIDKVRNAVKGDPYLAAYVRLCEEIDHLRACFAQEIADHEATKGT